MRSTLSGVALVGLIFWGVAGSARAAQMKNGNGSIVTTAYTSSTDLWEMAGLKFQSTRYTQRYTGYLDATCVQDDLSTHHADGAGTFTGTARCVGKVAGHPGSFSYHDYSIDGPNYA
jgi:hypothetical protein